jgi:hypothetical protein
VRKAPSLAEYQSALTAYRDAGDLNGVDSCIVNIGAWQMWHGDFEGGRQTLSGLRRDAGQIHTLSAGLWKGYGDIWEGHVGRAVRGLTAARDSALQLALPEYVAHAEQLLAEAYRLGGDAHKARRSINSALAKLAAIDAATLTAEVLALSARIHAESGERAAALADADAAEELAIHNAITGYSLVAWHLSITYRLLGDDAAARRFAEEAARAFGEDAMQMDADAAECWSLLPWHREVIAFLSGRDTSAAG